MPMQKLTEASVYLKNQLPQLPEVAVILGSGLSHLGDALTPLATIEYGSIPHFPKSSVVGHAGQLLLGQLAEAKKPVLFLKGRVHAYEGYDNEEVVFPVRLLKLLGVKTLIVTNAAGGVNPQYNAGDLMLITDHINFTGRNPLVGHNKDELGPRFPDMTFAYTPKLQQLALEKAQQLQLQLHQGIYAGVLGPSFETPAEIRMLQTLGADAVGMSTVSEVITASHMGLDVLGFSLISNKGAGLSGERLTHQEVLEEGEKAGKRLGQIILEVLKSI